MRSHLLLGLSIILICFSACKNDSSAGTNVIPDTHKVSLIQHNTEKVITYSIPDNPTNTRDIHLDNLSGNKFTSVVGSHDDPIFGKTVAGIYFDLEKENPEDDLGTSTALLDSVVLHVEIDNFYGDMSQMNQFDLYFLKDELGADQTLSSHTITLPSTPFSSYRFNLDSAANDSSKFDQVSNGTLDLHLNIDTFLTNRDSLFDHNLFDELRFYLVGSSSNYGAGLFKMLLKHNTKLGVYYSDTLIRIFDEDGNPDSTRSVERFFVPSENTSSLNTFQHDNSGTDVATAISTPNKTQGETLVYLQTMDAYQIKVELPDLKNLGNILISQAELEIELAVEDDIYPEPSQLILVADSSGNDLETIETLTTNNGSSENNSYFVGELENGKYSFNIGRYLQRVINGEYPNDGFYIRMENSHTFPTRIVLKGNNNTVPGIELKLKYTEIN